MSYIVQLTDHCWLAPWSGDPGRTTVRLYAKMYTTEHRAKIALGLARRYRPFKHAKIIELPE